MNLTLSNLAFGSMIFSVKSMDKNHCKNILNYLLENNINTIDTSISYGYDDNDSGGNEKLLSEILKNEINHYVISSKGGTYRKDNNYIPDNRINFLRKSCESSLKNLKLDTIPLYYLHAFDRVTPINDIANEFKSLKDENKILNIGLSNAEIGDVFEFQKIVPVFGVQNRLNPYFQKDFKTGMLDFCKDYNIKYYAYGIFNKINEELNDNVNNLLKKLAKKYDTSSQIISLLWLKSKGEHIIPILSSTNISNLEQSINAFNTMSLEKSDIDLIDEL